MTVAELIEHLRQLPPDMPVRVSAEEYNQAEDIAYAEVQTHPALPPYLLLGY